MRHIDVTDVQSRLDADRSKIVSGVRRLLDAEGVAACSLSIALVDDDRIRELNRRFLNCDRPTDVLSFDLSDDADELVGEIVVSAQRAADVAARRGADPAGELLLYVVHGCLHLLGYDDRTPARSRRMRRRENEILTQLGFPDVRRGSRRRSQVTP